MVSVKQLPGLPPYGPSPQAFPVDWGRLGRQGVVVEFTIERGSWVGNFQPGLAGLEFVGIHPNKEDAVVIASGDLWVILPESRRAERLLPAIDSAIEVHDPEGWIFSRQGLAFARLGPTGLIWHTRRLSWDGFDQVRIAGGEMTGLAWSPMDERWHRFRVDLSSGRSVGGSFSKDDTEGWETLAE
jgi:hypothetical protein